MCYSYAIRELGCQVCFSVKFWADVVRDTAFRPSMIPDSRTAERYRSFATNVLPLLLLEVPLSLRQVTWFQYDGAEARCG
jgi:hypothetical protein